MSTRPAILCVGAGRMGRGIAHVFAAAGHPVTLLDAKERPAPAAETLLSEAIAEIRGDLAFMAEIGRIEDKEIEIILDRIDCRARDEAPKALAEAGVIFEAVRETDSAKRDAFALINDHVRDEAIVSSTTSTMPVEDLALLVDRPGRFLNAHWLNPAWLIPLVEVSPGGRTEPRHIEAVTALLAKAGKMPVVCAAAPGYIVPRLQALIMNECARMVEEGVASAEEIDTAIKAGFGIRYAVLGVLEFVDWGGGDILYYASRHLQKSLDADRYAMPEIVETLMREGKTGMDAGQGFYDFRGRDVRAYRKQRLTEFARLVDYLGYGRKEEKNGD